MKLKGLAVSEGIAIGPVYLYRPYLPNVQQRSIEKPDVPAAMERYDAARGKARAELEALHTQMEENDPEKAAIFQAHLDILFDVVLDEEIRGCIEKELLAEDWAVHRVFTQYAGMLAEVDDALIRERAADMKDVQTRILRCHAGKGEDGLAACPAPAVVLAHDLLPSDTASLNRELTLGIITEVGGATSHSAIIARGYGIPAVLGVKDALAHVAHGDTVVLNAVNGEVIVHPTEDEVAQYTQRCEEERQQKQQLQKYLRETPVTRDGVRIQVQLNISSATQQELAAAQYTDGVGLFRTEFLFMGRTTLPNEEEQVAAYAKVFDAFGQKPVVIRTLDVGGDKQLGALDLPPEANPFLGRRALRLCLDVPELFNTQLRACLRAGAKGNLWLMFPMVGSLDDIRAAKAAVKKAEAELKAEGLPCAESYQFGIMIEIPSIAVMAAEVAKEVDFASIGTNDLTQYLLAADRMNPAVTPYYQLYHPAVFRLIGHIAAEFEKNGKPVGVCGELGGDKQAIAALVGLGVCKLSMGASSVAAAKKVITSGSLARMKALAGKVCASGTEREAKAHLEREMLFAMDA